MTEHHPKRVLQIAGALNFRDIGGYHTTDGRTVRWGKAYRSAQLDRLQPAGVQQLAALGVKTVVDLRFSDETAQYPTMLEAVPDAEILSWHDAQEADSEHRSGAMKRAWRDSLDTGEPAQVREAMRINYPQKLYTHRAIYREMLLRLASAQTPLIFHCAAGKDRTGVAAALILALLGVSDAQIVEDYLITQAELEGRMESWFAGGATTERDYEDFQEKLSRQPKELLKPIFDADRSYIETLLSYVSETYGGFNGYAEQKLRLPDDFVNSLQRQLLE